MLLQLTALTMSHHSLTHSVHISSSSVQTLVHDLQTIHLGSLVGGDCVETEESEADVLDQQRQAHRHHAYPGLGVDLYGGPAASCRGHHDQHRGGRHHPVDRSEALGQGELTAVSLHLVRLLSHST